MHKAKSPLYLSRHASSLDADVSLSCFRPSQGYFGSKNNHQKIKKTTRRISTHKASAALIINGDCTTELARLKDETVDLIVTSPPYADQRKHTYGGVTPDQYVEWFMPIADELYRVLNPQALLFST